MPPGPRIRRVPNQPKTPRWSFRIDPELLDQVKQRAKQRGETATAFVLEAIRLHLRRTEKD